MGRGSALRVVLAVALGVTALLPVRSSAAPGAEPQRVIVGLRAPFQPEGALAPSERSSQRAAIASRRQAVLDRTPARAVRAYATLPFVVLEADASQIAALRAAPDVTSIQADTPEPPALLTSLSTIGATDLWPSGTNGAGRTIAILDTGVDAAHPSLSGRVVEEACYSNAGGYAGGTSLCPNGQPSQTGTGSGKHCTGTGDCIHGTHVAGVAAGVAPGATIMSIQVFTRFDNTTSCGGASSCLLSYPSDQIAGLERVYALRSTRSFSSVNLSLSGGRHYSACDANQSSRKAAIDNLRSVGIATVVAAGNNGYADSIGAPSCISSAVAVGATTKLLDSLVWTFTNNHPSMVDVLAPGASIVSAVPGGGTASMSGTSMAAPHVAGAFALLRSHHPTAAVGDLLTALTSTGAPVLDARTISAFTRPRIRVAVAEGAVQAGAAPPPSVSVTLSFSTKGRGWIRNDAALCRTCTYQTTVGSVVTLRAKPMTGWRFVRWAGACKGSTRVCTLAPSGDLGTSAVFKRR